MRIGSFRRMVDESGSRVVDYVFEVYHWVPVFGKRIEFINPV